MNKLLTWFSSKRWRMSLSHCLEGLIIQLLIAIFTNLYIGALCVVVFYYSRKKLELEEEVKAPGASHTTTWSIGWFPWTWDKYKILDLVLPTFSSYLIAFFVQEFLL
jgi:hypothetical protein